MLSACASQNLQPLDMSTAAQDTSTTAQSTESTSSQPASLSSQSETVAANMTISQYPNRGTIIDSDLMLLSNAGNTAYYKATMALLKSYMGVPTTLAALSSDSTHQVVTSSQIAAWTAKQNALIAGADYLTPATAASTYAPIPTANQLYVTPTQVSTWNGKQNALIAGTDYLTPATAASTYLTPATAASTYLTPATAASTYAPIPTGTQLYVTPTQVTTWNGKQNALVAGTDYLTSASLTSTYQTKLSNSAALALITNVSGAPYWNGSAWPGGSGGGGNVYGLASGATTGDVVVFGADGYHLADAGVLSNLTAGTGITIGGTAPAYTISVTPTLPAGTIVGTTDSQVLSGKEYVAPLYSQLKSHTQGTGTINVDGTTQSDYAYDNGSSTATYTIVFTSLPPAGEVRRIRLTIGSTSASGVITIAWPTVGTSFGWYSTAGSTTTTTNKRNSYDCTLDSVMATCAILGQGY